MNSKRVTLLAGVVIVLAAFTAYHNSFSVPFIFDDQSSIVENRTIRQLWPIWHALSPPRRGGLTVEGRPLVNLSLAINYALGGTATRGYHVVNLVVHILAGLTLFGVVRRTLRQPELRERFGAAAVPLALAASVIWTVHPLQTESVTYVVQRAESLAGLFYLLTLYCFIRGADCRAGCHEDDIAASRGLGLSEGLPAEGGAQPGGHARPTIWYALSVMACALGMASKEVMATAPFVVLFYDRTFVAGTFREAWRRRWWLYLALATTWILLAYLAVSMGIQAKQHDLRPGLTWWTYALTQPGVILHYLRLAIWPHPLCFDYGWEITRDWRQVFPPSVLIVTLATVTAWACRKKSPSGFLGAWFFATLAPSSSIIVVRDLAFEHRMYLPLAAVAAVVVVGTFVVRQRLKLDRMVGWGLSIAIVAFLTVMTIRRNVDYHSQVAIWQDTVIKRPENPRAHLNLGNALSQTGRIKEAIRHYEESVRIKPDMAEAHNNLGVALVEVGRLDEAIGHYERAMQIKPEMAEGYNGLAWLLATDTDPRLRDPARAVQLAERACALTARQDPWILDTLAAAYAAAGRYDDAIQTAQQATSAAVTAGHEELVNGIQGRLDLYKTGQPFRRKPIAGPDS